MNKIAPPEPFDFDRIEVWGPQLFIELHDVLPREIRKTMAASELKYVEDADDVLFKLVNRKHLAECVRRWLEKAEVFAYHGTRVTPEEEDSIRRHGLVPLEPATRTLRLRRSLSSHPNWKEVEPQLESVISDLCSGKYGNRLGQVHLTVSRAGLVRGFNHYLIGGSEFDWQAAALLLGDEGRELLKKDGEMRVVKLRVPGQAAFAACNPPRWPLSDLPNLVREILREWSYWLARPSHQSEEAELDCGLIFFEKVSPTWIEEIVPIAPHDLLRPDE